MNHDPVNHPSHYTDGKYECIDFIESWGLGFHLGNAIKYITRAGKKDPAKEKEDLEKALWYLRRYEKLQFKPNKITNGETIDIVEYCQDKSIPMRLFGAVIEILANYISDAIHDVENYIELDLKERSEACEDHQAVV